MGKRAQAQAVPQPQERLTAKVVQRHFQAQKRPQGKSERFPYVSDEAKGLYDISKRLKQDVTFYAQTYVSYHQGQRISYAAAPVLHSYQRKDKTKDGKPYNCHQTKENGISKIPKCCSAGLP